MVDNWAIIFAVQVIVGVVLIFRSVFSALVGQTDIWPSCGRRKRRSTYSSLFVRKSSEQETDTEPHSQQSEGTTDGDELARSATEAIFQNISGNGTDSDAVRGGRQVGAMVSALWEMEQHREWQAARRASYERKRSIFGCHFRTEDNFIRGNTDPELVRPPKSPIEIEQPYYTRIVLYGFLRHAALRNLFLQSLGWASLSGAMGTLLCVYHDSNINESMAWVQEYQRLFSELLSDFKWLPTFMVVNHCAFYIQRWRNFILHAWEIEGFVLDLGIIIGSDARDPDDPASRRLLFKIYRYMVLAMALQYREILPALKDSGPYLCHTLHNLGLLTPEEAAVLQPQSTRMRDAVLAWIALEVKHNDPSGTGLLLGGPSVSTMAKLTSLRNMMVDFHRNNFCPQPNQWAAFMTLLVDAYCLLLVMVYPFKFLVPLHITKLYGFQAATVMAVFLMNLCFGGVGSLAYAFSSPFANRVDTFNIDALVAGTEETLFAVMRVGFDRAARRGASPKVA